MTDQPAPVAEARPDGETRGVRAVVITGHALLELLRGRTRVVTQLPDDAEALVLTADVFQGRGVLLLRSAEWPLTAKGEMVPPLDLLVEYVPTPVAES